MEATARKTITIETSVNAPAAKVWECWTRPEHITQWNHASDELHRNTKGWLAGDTG